MSHATLAEQQSFLNLLNRSCQQRTLYLKSLKLLNNGNQRNNGNIFLAPLITATLPNGNASNPEFATADLDMRRKAEILKYNGASTQGGQKQTRSQYFAQLNRKGSSRYADFSNYITSIRTCANNKDNIPTSTSSSNVPGPPINLIYNPNIPLYNYIGMQQNMPQNAVPALINPPYLSQTFGSNQSVVRYTSFYTNPVGSTTLAPTVSPALNLSYLTFYTIPSNSILSCTTNFQLSAVVNFDIIDTNGKLFSSAIPMKTVKTIQFQITNLQAVTFLMTEPQKFTSDYVLLSQDIPFPAFNQMTSLPTIPYSGQKSVNQNFSFNFQPNSPITFPVTDNIKSASVSEQTDRICFNVVYYLTFLDAAGKQISTDAMNITNLSIKFTLNPMSVTYSLPSSS